MPTTYAFPGYVGDVVTLTGRIESTWAEAIRDRALQVFTTAALRTAGLASPQVGQVSVLTAAASANDTGIWQYVGATDGWTKPWNLPWGEMGTATATASQGTITTVVDLTSMSIAFTAIANRIYETFFDAQSIQSSVTTDRADIQLTDATPTTLHTKNFPTATPCGVSLYYRETGLSAGAITRKMRALRGAGTGNVQVNASATSPMRFTVKDAGPNGAPA